MNIGDLVKYCGNKHLYIIIEILFTSEEKTKYIKIQNTTTGKKSSLPLHWLTKVETDNL